MKLRAFSIITTILAGGLFAQHGWAADAPPASQCGWSALLEMDGSGRYTSFPSAGAGADTSQTNYRLDGTAAANYGCGLYNIQGLLTATDVLPWQYNFGGKGYTYNDLNGAGEVDVFLRDPQQFAVGVGLSHYLEDEHRAGFGGFAANNFDLASSFYYGKAFGEYYLNDQITLGATVYYGAGDDNNGFTGVDAQENELGGSAYVRYYATPDLRLGLRGYVGQVTDTTNNQYFTYDYGIASGEYKFDATPVSVMVNLRYGQTGALSATVMTREPSNYVQGAVGVTVALGDHSNGTLLEQDRGGVLLH